MHRRGHSLKPTEAAKLLGTDKLYWSPSRLEIAHLVNRIMLHTLRLFDLTSLTTDEIFLIKYAQKKLFEKMQTMFQMGKHEEFHRLLDYCERVIPRLRELANRPDVFVTVDGSMLNPDEQKRTFNKPLPKRVRQFIEKHFLAYVVR